MRTSLSSSVLTGLSIWVVLSLGFGGCDARRMSTTDGGGVRDCLSDSDCNDGFDCTLESCGVGNTCVYTTLDTRCGAGETCVEGRGCVTGTACTSTADCDDSVACTVDTCGVGGTCRHMALDELCTDTALPSCDPTMGCVRGTGCMSAADCDDTIACTIDSCGTDHMCRHTPMDALCMAGETCNTATGCFMSMPCTVAADCDDGVFCNGTERCQPEFGCTPGPVPACDDSQACTIDSCDTTLNRCAHACDRAMTGCTAVAECATPPTSCAGVFVVATPPTNDCAVAARFNLSQLTFANDGVVLDVQDRSRLLRFTDATDPICPTFAATSRIEGGCTEVYRLSGTFTDDDHFVGTFEYEYVDTMAPECSFPELGLTCCGGCEDGGVRSFDITGTRM